LVKKFTLTVSDDEYEVINKWKKRFNFSKVFRDAILLKISALERVNVDFSDAVDIEMVVKRLRIEKEQDDLYFASLGGKDALVWASRATYNELKYLDSWSIPFDDGEVSLKRLTGDTVLGEYFKLKLDENEKMRPGNRDTHLSLQAKSWLTIWEKAAKELWSQVKSKL